MVVNKNYLNCTIFLYIACIISVLSAAACTRAETETQETVFRFALSGEPDTLDPHATTGTLTFQVVRSVYDTLLEIKEDGSWIPALAKEIIPDSSGLEYTIYLRENVRFHHGKVLTAEDVMASIERLRDPEFASPSMHEYESISSVSVLDNLTLLLRMKRVHAPLFSSLASGWSAILPADLIKSGHNFAHEPVGTGPFVFSDWQRGVAIELEKNDSYRKENMPNIQQLRFDLLKDPMVRAQALLEGSIQGIDLVVDPELELLNASSDVTVHKTLSSMVLVIALNHRRSPLNNPEFRSAINAAIDKETVLNVAYGGGVVVGSFMDPPNPYYSDLSSDYNPGLAEEFFSRNQLDQPLIISVPQNFEPHRKAAELYQDMLAKAGLQTEIELLEWSSWLSQVYRQFQFDLTVIGHTGKLDPDGRLAGYGSDSVYVGWINTEVSDLLNTARSVLNFEQRKSIYDRVLRIMADEFPFIFIGSPYRHIALQKGIKGFMVHAALDTYDFTQVIFEQ